MRRSALCSLRPLHTPPPPPPPPFLDARAATLAVSWCAAPPGTRPCARARCAARWHPRPRRGAPGGGGRAGRKAAERAGAPQAPNTVEGGRQACSDMQPPAISAGGVVPALASVAPVDPGRGMAPCAKSEHSASTVRARPTVGRGDRRRAVGTRRARPTAEALCSRLAHGGPAPWRARAWWVGGRPPRGGERARRRRGAPCELARQRPPPSTAAAARPAMRLLSTAAAPLCHPLCTAPSAAARPSAAAGRAALIMRRGVEPARAQGYSGHSGARRHSAAAGGRAC